MESMYVVTQIMRGESSMNVQVIAVTDSKAVAFEVITQAASEFGWSDPVWNDTGNRFQWWWKTDPYHWTDDLMVQWTVTVPNVIRTEDDGSVTSKRAWS